MHADEDAHCKPGCALKDPGWSGLLAGVCWVEANKRTVFASWSLTKAGRCDAAPRLHDCSYHPKHLLPRTVLFSRLQFIKDVYIIWTPSCLSLLTFPRGVGCVVTSMHRNLLIHLLQKAHVAKAVKACLQTKDGKEQATAAKLRTTRITNLNRLPNQC